MRQRAVFNLPEELQHIGQQRFQQWLEAKGRQSDEFDDTAQAMIRHCFALSDFVFQVCERQPECVTDIIAQQQWVIDVSYAELCQQVLDVIDDENQFFAAIRRLRHREMARITISDLLVKRSTELSQSDDFSTIIDSMQRVSELADALICAAYNWAFRITHKQWGMPFDADENPQPMLILGMGKLGGKELNFSSDIDLIFTYPESGNTAGARRQVDNQQFFVRVSQRLISALNQVTVDGQVFRVDMRLRPFGESGPIVTSFSAMEDYYQEQGREWERYAMVKARVLNQTDYNEALGLTLRPFVYRRYIDFGVVESLRKMKRLIAQETRRRGLVNNIKLGTGGIREVEFIVQSLQLIRGGREQVLQTQSLLAVLTQLCALSMLPEPEAKSLRACYLRLREVEHFLQQFADQQTQTLPEKPEDQLRLAALFDLSSYAELTAHLDTVMQLVHDEFMLVIGEEAEQDDDIEACFVQCWESAEFDDELFPDELNEKDKQAFFELLLQFKADVEKARVGQRGLATLDKLMPVLLSTFAAQRAKLETVSRVFTVLKRVLSRTAYLDLLHENQGALKQLIKLCASSRWVVQQLANYPMLLDELIDPAIFERPIPLTEYRAELNRSMLRAPDDDLEVQMDMLRQFKLSMQLKIAAADISGALPLMKVSDHLTVLAEVLLGFVVRAAWTQIAERHGTPDNRHIDDMGLIVIGYGKLGGFELGYGSDLDLVFLHNWSAEEAGSVYTDGKKPIDVRQFYLKVVQRIVHLCTTRMTSGQLYDVDTRLRPSGNSGPLSINIETYLQYLQEEAWTWEHQALVRARPVFSQQGQHACALNTRYQEVRASMLQVSRDPDVLRADVVSMRNKMRQHLSKDTQELFDLKQGAGGIVDIEFLVQYMVLRWAATYQQLTQFTDNVRLLESLKALGLVTEEDVAELIIAYQALRSAQHRLALQEEEKLIDKASAQAESARVLAHWQHYVESCVNT